MQNIIYRKSENETWLLQDYLLQLLEPHGLTKTYLDCKARKAYKESVQPCYRNKTYLPATGKAWRWAKVDGCFYYEYDSIPDKAPANYLSNLPTRKDLIAMTASNAGEKKGAAMETFFTPYLNDHYKTYLPVYGDCTVQQQHSLAKAAAFLEGACAYITEHNIDTSKNEVFQSFASYIDANDIKYLPGHYRNIKTLVLTASISDSIAPLVKLPRSGNQNATVHAADEELKSWIIAMRYCDKNFTNAHIIRKLQWMCLVCEKPMPSDRWIGEVMEEANTKFLTAGGRYGAKGRFGQPYRGYTPFANALYAGDCWQVDGSRFNIIDFKLNVEVDGKVQAKQVFLYVVAVRDVHSGDILGYSFNVSENRWTVHNALKMAVEEAGYLPYEIVFDRFPGHNTPEMKAFFVDLENRGVKVTFSHKAQGKAKVERWFRTMQEVFMQVSDYYYGEGILSRNRYAHRSKEYLKKIRSEAKADGWDFDKASEEAGKIIEAYRSTALNAYSRKFKTVAQSPAQLHEQSEKPNVRPIEPYQFAYLFGLRRKLQINNMGLIGFEMQGVRFNYRCSDYDVVSKYSEVTICYSLDNMSAIHLYEVSDKPIKRHLGTATAIEDIVPYGPEAFKGYGKDAAILRELNDFRQQELDYKLAVGYDSLSIMDSGNAPKQIYEQADAAATFQETFGVKEDDGGDYDIRSQYS